jgi:hypothetical protein
MSGKKKRQHLNAASGAIGNRDQGLLPLFTKAMAGISN